MRRVEPATPRERSPQIAQRRSIVTFVAVPEDAAERAANHDDENHDAADRCDVCGRDGCGNQLRAVQVIKALGTQNVFISSDVEPSVLSLATE